MQSEFLFVFLVSMLSNMLLVRWSGKLGLIDVPNCRSTHTCPTPHSGGIGIFVSFAAGMALFEPSLFLGYPLLFVATAMVFAVGVADDRFGTSPKLKFFVIFAATLVAALNGFEITSLGTYFGAPLSLGWFALPFTLFAVAGFTNALNLIDGIDMLAATVAGIILLTLAYIGFRHGDVLLLHGSLAAVAALGGFLVFNAHPARIFMGDSGALTLGFLISMLSIRALEYIDATVILFIATVPVLDTLIVMVRRIRRGRSPFVPDKTHLHHVIMRLKGGNVRLSVAILAAIQLSFSLIGLELADNEPFVNLFVFGLILFVFYTLFTVRSAQTQKAKQQAPKRTIDSWRPFSLLKRRG